MAPLELLGALGTVTGSKFLLEASDLMRSLRSASRAPRRVVVVHGDPGPAAALAARVRRELTRLPGLIGPRRS